MNKRSVIAVLILTVLFRVTYSGTTGKISSKIIDANISEPTWEIKTEYSDVVQLMPG
ncbi:MAG: hypothetical protein KAU06_05860 [Candidatus Marinimicrobia bacterium]|nr:hypothetical protein [Candidatus Neomarinimicrobiota bacterium]